MTLSLSLSIVRRHALGIALAGAACLILAGCTVPASAPATTVAESGHIHDFDLFVGTWHSRQRRLKERLAGSDEWEEFEGTQTFQPILGGQGNTTDNAFTLPDGTVQRGFTLRAFDPRSQTWSIWWLSGNAPTRIDVPVVGRFENGVGTFYADDSFDGKPIKVRFLWLNITPTSRRWEQAFSADGGKTWETNWTADFTKAG